MNDLSRYASFSFYVPSSLARLTLSRLFFRKSPYYHFTSPHEWQLYSTGMWDDHEKYLSCVVTGEGDPLEQMMNDGACKHDLVSRRMGLATSQILHRASH